LKFKLDLVRPNLLEINLVPSGRNEKKGALSSAMAPLRLFLPFITFLIANAMVLPLPAKQGPLPIKQPVAMVFSQTVHSKIIVLKGGFGRLPIGSSEKVSIRVSADKKHLTVEVHFTLNLPLTLTHNLTLNVFQIYVLGGTEQYTFHSPRTINGAPLMKHGTDGGITIAVPVQPVQPVQPGAPEGRREMVMEKGSDSTRSYHKGPMWL